MLKSKRTTTALRFGASALALLAVSGAAYAQTDSDLETIVVTGYRASLEKAMDIKRNSLDASDSILAEDIAKFPDMNVSESLQRIPGVALNRESGEGREITVRGLGAQFTRVLINGIEAIATVGSQDVSTSNPGSGAGGTNRGRGFDFNVFASDLFTALTVHKSNSASLEEGSLGATVALRTARPFDHQGFIFTTSAQAGYQSLAGSVNPRVAALVSDTFLGGRVGILFSGAYGTSNTLEEGTSSVRWMSDLGNSASYYPRYNPVPPNSGANVTSNGTNNNRVAAVNGSACSTTAWETSAQRTAAAPSNATSSTAALSTGCSDFNMAFRPRFPRYDIVDTHSKRLGLTGAFQWQADEKTLFTIDGLYADFAQIRNERYLEANSFSSGANTNVSYVSGGTTYHATSLGTRNINVLSYALGGPTGLDGTLHSTNTVQKLTATGVGLRAEHRLDHLDTRFMQVTIDGTHEFSDTVKGHILAGWSESHHRNPIQATLAADLGCAGTGAGSATTPGCTGAGPATDPYAYDYSVGNMPMLHVGDTGTSAWFLSNVRERQEFAYNSYRSIALDVEWKANKSVTITAGFDHRNFGFGSLETRRSTGGTGELATIPDSVRAVNLNSYVETAKLRGIDIPSGSTTSWLVPDLNKAASAINLWSPSVFPLNAAAGYSNSGNVRENDYAGWLQASWDTEVAGMGLRGDMGVRYVETAMSSLGYTLVGSTITPQTGGNVYHDWLPSTNIVLSPLDDVQIRFNASYALTRPGLTGMLPTGSVSVSGSNATANVGNPKIPPTRSKNLDLAFEWYYGKGSMISVAGFYKHLDNFIQNVQTSGIWSANPWGWSAEAFVGACGGSGTDWSTVTNSFCISQGRANMSWTYTYAKSQKGAPLYGTEINWQQQFYFLPGPLENMGLLANYTYVQAQQTYLNSTGGLLMTADLNNLSRNSYNATIYYDDNTYQARLTASSRSHYIIDPNIATNYNNYGIFVKGTFNLDASASYKMNESLMFTFDALNLTNQASNIYADATAQRSYQFHKTGQVFYLGAKYTY